MGKINIAIVGSRNFNNYIIFKQHVHNTLYEWDMKITDIDKIISGGAIGVE